MNTEEREISLIDLMIYVAKGWKAVLIWMLAMAIAVTGIQYAREVKSLKDFQNQQPANEEEEKEQAILTIEQLRQEMSDEEKKAVSKVMRLEKEYDKQTSYLQNSIIMGMDPYKVSIARIQYWVDTDYEVDYAGITEKDLTPTVMSAYVNRLLDGEWKQKAMEAADIEADVQYMGELIGIGVDGATIKITIKYSDEKQLRKMVDVAEKELQECKKELEKVLGKHELSLMSKSIDTIVDNDIYNAQQNRQNVLLGLENNIASYKNAFNDDQKSLYAGQILVDDEDEDETDEELEEEEIEMVEPPTPQVRAKNILLGAVLGAFLICMIRAMAYILSGKLKAEDNVGAYFGVPELGCILQKQPEHKGAFRKLDSWLDSLSRRNYGNLAKEKQIQMAASNISLYCEKGNIKNLFFNSSVNYEGEEGREIFQELKRKGIAVKSGYSILMDASAMEEMSKAEGIVFVEQAGKSRYEDMEREIKLCKELGKTVIGLVVLS